MCRSENRGEKGAVTVIFTLMLPIFVAFLGLAIDIGWLYVNRVKMENAADTGSLAGAFQLKRGSGAASIQAMARHDAGLNGFTHGVDGVNVIVNSPPTSGNFSGDPSYVEVIVQKSIDTFFIKIVHPNPIAISGRAVAGMPLTAAQTCLITLNTQNTNRSLWVRDWSNAQMPNCEVSVNSTHNKALTVVGATTTLNAKKISIVGGYDIDGTVTPLPITGAPTVLDPLAAYVPPAPGACTFTSQQIYTTSQTINPGVYCGGILIRNTVTINFNPGVYYLVGGGLTTASNATLNGAGVTFINTFKDHYLYDPIDIGGSGAGAATITLSAPTSGTTAGILFYNDPASKNKISKIGWPSAGGNKLMNLTGLLYFPSTQLNFNSGSATVGGDYTYIIAEDMNIIGNNFINSSGNAPLQISTGNESGAVAIVE